MAGKKGWRGSKQLRRLSRGETRCATAQTGASSCGGSRRCTHTRSIRYKMPTGTVKRVIEGNGRVRGERGDGGVEGKSGKREQRENVAEIVNGSASVRSRVFRNHCYVK